MPLYPNPATIPASTTALGDLTVAGNLTGQHDVSASGTFNASAGNGLKLPAGSTPLTPSSASTMYGLANTGMPAAVSDTGLVMSMGGALQVQTSTVTVANTAAATVLQTFTVPASDVAAGALYRMTGYGVYSTTGTPTLQFILYWGGVAGTALATIPAITTPSGISSAPFFFTALMTCRSTTSVFGALKLNLDTSVVSDAVATYTNSPAAASTITSTGANDLTVGVTWGTASSSNTISLLGGTVERVA